MRDKTPPAMLTPQQAKALWKNMSLDEKIKFNEMYKKLTNGELLLTKVNVDDNEQIQSIVLDDKDKPGKPAEPFYKHFQP